MTDKLLCPFCQQELKRFNEPHNKCAVWVCKNYNDPDNVCVAGGYLLNDDMLNFIYDTKKKLDICEGALEEYKDWFNKSQDRLKIAIDALTTIRRYTAINQFQPKSREAHIIAKKVLAEINKKEQQ